MIPNNTLSTELFAAAFIDTARQDSEMGGVGINDTSQGLRVKLWRVYEEDGDVKITAPGTAPITLFSWPDVRELSLAFDQNMNPFVAFYTGDGAARYWWFDSTIPGMTFSVLPAGSITPRATLDDKRETQTSNSDVILAYLRDGFLYFRQQRDRFLTEYQLGFGLPAGARLATIQMNSVNRLQFQLSDGTGNTLSDIVQDIAGMVGVTDLSTQALAGTIVRGYLAAGGYTAADAIRGLQHAYRFDMSEVDGSIVAVQRGGASLTVIARADMLVGEENTFVSAREQGVEFPRKMHVMWSGAEMDYMPQKATSERRSPDLRVVGEMEVEYPINYDPNEAAQTADILHKELWTDLEGSAEFSLDESWASLAPADIVFVEFFPGVLKRMRISTVSLGPGFVRVEAITDRQTVYTSVVSAAPRLVSPDAPTVVTPVATLWEFMDLPALITAHDGLHFYVAARGAGSPWRGAVLQRAVDGEFFIEAAMPFAEAMGSVEEATGAARGEFTDRTNTLLVALNEAPLAVTRAQILQGRNAVLVGNEIMQFEEAVEEGELFRLSVLARGRLNTPISAHAIGERVVMLNAPVLVPIDPSLLNTSLLLRAPSVGAFPESAVERNETFTGRSQREWAPVRLRATRLGNDDWTFVWTPRWRLGSSANPIQSTHFTGWRLRFTVGAVTVMRDAATASFTYSAAAQTADFGAVQATLSVEVVGRNTITGDGDALTETVP